ncbi:hypothetical protein KEU06_00200 [Pseudaminobacter sp. 19-2017]|uniref:Uncharacterized protein n=1 Tax=Pseudaminobacter soli (ex Zhang et al. 2022) TaxID=2831468 RepID=A0A942I7G0_9HYPH|nr:hypothetical protein [Pseudaminobacter soli]MBS3647046.1 hypothetical protein [Pseudaminobacter soli]
MDGSAAIERNRQWLKRIVTTLLAMAGLDGEAAFTSPLWGGRREASGGGRDAENTPTPRSDGRRPPHKGEVKLILPRRLHRAILRLLWPAEAAARRLIIAAARGLIVALPPQRESKPKPATMEPVLRRLGIAVVMSPADLAGAAAATGRGALAGRPRPLSLPLIDRPRRILSLSKESLSKQSLSKDCGYRPYASAYGAPRILFPGLVEPSSFPAPPSPDDPIDASRLGRRLAALAAALDDLPGQAKRFARWKARRDAMREARATGRIRRISPLRAGRPPGGRLPRFDPSASRPRNVREVDEVLAHAHALAIYALERPDTS